MRYVICTAALTAVLFGAKWLMDMGFAQLGYWGGMGICAAIVVFSLITAALMDADDRRRVRQGEPPRWQD
jgi:hypothetical protein